MSVLPIFPPYYCTSPPLPHEWEAEEHLFHQKMIDDAEQERLCEYLREQAAAPVPACSTSPPPAEPLAALASAVQNLAMIEEDEELDDHSCADSGCAGIHTHADYYDDDYECGHRSPDAYANMISPTYYPATPPYD